MKLYLSEITQPTLAKKVLLLKIEDGDSVGISSLMSWPHLKDPTHEELKNDLLTDQKYELTKKSIFFALKDLNSENLKSLTVPRSHTLLKDEFDIPEHIENSKIKLKPKQSFQALAKTLNTYDLKKSSLRIDFNNKLNEQEFFEFLNLCNKVTIQSIDFIEDPLPFNKSSWLEVKSQYPSIRLAVDHSDFIDSEGFDFFIWKPSKSFYNEKPYRVISTHYMSHEIEWYCSLWEASLHEKLFEECCGFGTQHLKLQYKPGDQLKINKHWNQDINSFKWSLMTEDFQLAFKLT